VDRHIRMQNLTLIAGICQDRGIGLGNELLVRLPEDMAHFKALTLGHTVLMGRKTWDSIPPRFRPLPGRRNLVLSRQAGLNLDGAEVFASLDAALSACAPGEQVFVMGGAEIYAQALPRATALELTEFDVQRPADAFFPAWSAEAFDEVSRQAHLHAPSQGESFAYAFVRLERRTTR